MIDGIGTVEPYDLTVVGGTPLLTGRIDVYFTRDYNIIVHPGRAARVKGGFLAVRTDLVVYEEYCRIVLEGDHQLGYGWGGKGHGEYYGAQKIQGLCAH